MTWIHRPGLALSTCSSQMWRSWSKVCKSLPPLSTLTKFCCSRGQLSWSFHILSGAATKTFTDLKKSATSSNSSSSLAGKNATNFNREKNLNSSCPYFSANWLRSSKAWKSSTQALLPTLTCLRPTPMSWSFSQTRPSVSFLVTNLLIWCWSN